MGSLLKVSWGQGHYLTQIYVFAVTQNSAWYLWVTQKIVENQIMLPPFQIMLFDLIMLIWFLQVHKEIKEMHIHEYLNNFSTLLNCLYHFLQSSSL